MQTASQVILESASTDADTRLKEFAERLAKAHQIHTIPALGRDEIEIAQFRRAALLDSLHAWEAVLHDANAVFKSSPSRELPVSRAGEWMLDNFYIVKQTIRQIEEALPPRFFVQLPKLSGTPFQGHPRIFAVAQEWISYNQSQIDLVQIAAFVQEYQQFMPLTIGELWALPIMLRIGILERLARATAELTGLKLPRETGETLKQSATPTHVNENIVANCFLGLRLLATTDWKAIFEQVSRVEQVLRNDPTGVYPAMDFDTRNQYRSVIEELGWYSKLSEEQIALAALDLARNVDGAAKSRKSHIGYYLLDAGRATLERNIHYWPGLGPRIRRTLMTFPTTTYLGSILIFTWLFFSGLLSYAERASGSTLQLVIVVLLGAGLALEAAIVLVNWLVTHLIKPQSLPRMDFAEGIPAGDRTMVVVPTLLENTEELKHLLQELELYYLANSDPQLTYALLTDFGDAPLEHMPEDDELLQHAQSGIEQLNKKYAQTRPFYLFHRQRQWNPSEGAWMGWERKRGKLADFNRLLLGQAETESAYTTQVGNLEILPFIKFVITLDADTSLTQGSASRLVATLAHPLNRAEFSADGRTVIAGYTVLQPRVNIKPTSANRSLFSRIYTGNSGFDLYSFAVSDVYQDLFGEGSYVGKGIYDVAAFERSLEGQVRPNTLLSHDLFEGIHGRAALVTDVILYEDYPSRYLAYTRRLSRWVRGDWQLLPWLFPRVPTRSGHDPNRLSIIDLWKIFDNLRRSLLPPTLLALLAAAWTFLPGSPWLWTMFVLLPSLLPLLVQTIQEVSQNWHNHPTLKQLFEPTRIQLTHWALGFLFLPYEALLMLAAIRTTLARLIARRHMLQWATAASIARMDSSDEHLQTWREMLGSVLISVLVLIAVIVFKPAAMWIAWPFLLGWAVAPQVAYIISLPATREVTRLTPVQRRQVQRLARRTWAFFEQYAGPNDHWLPPDHFQETPLGRVAHYTTPTNIGLFLTSALSAFDLGYISMFDLAVRLRSTFESIDRLEHYRGHLLNWYDSQTLTAIPPHYVSTVDSGNLAACLITLRQGLLDLKDAPLLGQQQWRGLLSLLDILSEVLEGLGKDTPGELIDAFDVELERTYERVRGVPNQLIAWHQTLEWVAGAGWDGISNSLMKLLDEHPNLKPEFLSEFQLYLDLTHHHIQDMQRNLKLFAPWLSRMDAPLLQTPAGQTFRASLPEELPTLGQATATYERLQSALSQLDPQEQDAQEWCHALEADLLSARLTATPLWIGFHDLAEQAEAAVKGMDFRFLFDERRQIFHIGYNASTERLDPNYYDLLASEARIASLVAIAKGDVPPSHWQYLGRPVTNVDGKQVLLSWSGTMFEYLMPVLFVRNYEGTFLSESCYAALDAHISYGREQQTPWGISESGFYAFDASLNYQYRAFGVPDLGYKRDLHDDLVIAPYASLLGLPLQPQAVVENMTHLEKLHQLGRYGFYEALDYTRTHLPPGQTQASVKEYMAHHQSMILVSACNYLAKDIMVKRFHSDERIRSVELLLQEKIPQGAPLEYPHPDEPTELPQRVRSVDSAPWQVPVDSTIPLVHLIARGESSMLITNSGAGYSQWRDMALTRWQADSTLDAWGTWIYVQDRDSGALWSVTGQPIGGHAENQEVLFFPHKVEFRRWDHGISLHTEISISADGVEIRRVTLLNDSDQPRQLKLVSYGEVVLAPQAVDRRHPAFNKLFIESEFLPNENALLFHRRPRSAEEKPIFMAHALRVEVGRKLTGEHESDRARFLGRLHSLRSPQALSYISQRAATQLSGTVGGTLDPIFSLAQDIDLKPHTRTRVTFLTAAGSSRTEVLEHLTHYQTPRDISSAFDDARANGEHEMFEMGLTTPTIEDFQRLLSALLYPTGRLRAEPHILAQNEKGQSGLWGFGVSGDYPILLVRIHGGESTLLVEALQAFHYWRQRHLTVNLVILNEQDTGYSSDLHNAIYRQIHRLGLDTLVNQRDGIFILRSDLLSPSDKILLDTVAGVILDEHNGNMADHSPRLLDQRVHLPPFIPAPPPEHDPEPTHALPLPTDLVMDNGLGGFSPDGKEYVIYLQPGQHTPHPWVNVIANAQFGFLVSEAGSSCTWAENSGENRLTPWRNDPVSDMPGEAIYLRDEETGQVWSPTILPAGADTTHLIRHGLGYSVFESQSHGLNQNLHLFVAPDAPVKIARLRLKNLWDRPRRVTVTYYAEWVLGTTRDTFQAHIMPEFDAERNALLAFNRYNSEFASRLAFLAASKKPHGVTTDRTEFLGRLGDYRQPAALGRIGLASAVNAGLDPCAALQLHVDLAPGATEEVFFLLGEGASREESLQVIERVQGQVEEIWQQVQHQWDEVLSTITVETPDPSMDLMLNHWLLYQALSCRVWGRTALYQSSGAFGFRDQLQDVLALLYACPDLTRAQIVEAARHQFEAGDVLHWWNPPWGRGVRTRFADDLLWLPYVTAEYVTVTGDESILRELVPFLKADPLKPEEHERYAQYEQTAETYPIYEHCRRALEKGTTSGVHGIPLMGAGDWNDGMNRVGIKGKGESIWLGWFLHATLTRFASLARIMDGDVDRYLQQAEQYAQALEASAWDGEWYLRAFYDDGSRLGSQANRECQIDAIAQSWAVLSGAGDQTRAEQAMESVYRLLVKPDEKLILLFTPPFDKSARDPGYIKGYLPGIRENGGQYTHAAIWSAWAFAKLGKGERAMELFNLLNPIHHAETLEQATSYKVEPYVIAADIYSVPPHVGRGGWTWYTGSSGWMYRLGIEAILGISRTGKQLHIQPCIPSTWSGYKIAYRFGRSHYRISVENPDHVEHGVKQVFLDEKLLPDSSIPLHDDAQVHEARVVLG